MVPRVSGEFGEKGEMPKTSLKLTSGFACRAHLILLHDALRLPNRRMAPRTLNRHKNFSLDRIYTLYNP